MAQFTITLTRAQLRSALIFAAEKDIRYYLNGVLLQVGECGDCRLVATDGHRLAVLAVGDHPGATPGEYIIPREAIKPVKRASRTNGQSVQVDICIPAENGDTRGTALIKSGADIIAGGALIPGKFPDWQRVCPEPSRMSGEPGTFNAFYLGDIGAALVEFGDKFPALEILHNGTSAGLVLNPEHGLMVAIMPMRGSGFVPTDSARAQFMPRRPVFAAVVETAQGGQAFPCDPAQDVGDKRRAELPAPPTLVEIDPDAPPVVARCGADIAAWLDPSGALQAAGLLSVVHADDSTPAEPAPDAEYLEYLASMQPAPLDIAA